MPDFGNAKSKKGKKSKSKSSYSKSNKGSKKSRRNVASTEQDQDEEVIIGVTAPEEEDEEVDTPQEIVIEKVTPFSDGLVANCLSGLIVVPRVGGDEVDLFKGFLYYFAITEPFIGAVSNKLSFMKKKGGLLL